MACRMQVINLILESVTIEADNDLFAPTIYNHVKLLVVTVMRWRQTW